ncbi:MAG: hypothetical protein ACK4Z6_02295 [Candidatus Methylomirabilales bacterium]
MADIARKIGSKEKGVMPGRSRAMKGIQFVVDDTGKKRAVLIDLSEWGELWEDIYDVLISQSRKDEPTVPWEELKAEMEREERKGG